LIRQAIDFGLDRKVVGQPFKPLSRTGDAVPHAAGDADAVRRHDDGTRSGGDWPWGEQSHLSSPLGSSHSSPPIARFGTISTYSRK
jgi:hypothetical protein